MPNKILEVLRKEMLRCANLLPTLDPTTQEYSVALHNYETLSWKVSILENPTTDLDFLPAPKPVEATPDDEPNTSARTADPEPAAAAEEPKAEEPKAEEPVVVDDKTDWAAYRVSLRERMADARIGGLDTKALLAKVGATKFSTIPDEELPALAAALDEALKEKG